MVDKNWSFHNQQYINLKICTNNTPWYPKRGGWVYPRAILGPWKMWQIVCPYRELNQNPSDTQPID